MNIFPSDVLIMTNKHTCHYYNSRTIQTKKTIFVHRSFVHSATSEEKAALVASRVSSASKDACHDTGIISTFWRKRLLIDGVP